MDLLNDFSQISKMLRDRSLKLLPLVLREMRHELVFFETVLISRSVVCDTELRCHDWKWNKEMLQKKIRKSSKNRKLYELNISIGLLREKKTSKQSMSENYVLCNFLKHSFTNSCLSCVRTNSSTDLQLSFQTFTIGDIVRNPNLFMQSSQTVFENGVHHVSRI